ncbi:MAG: HAD family hydrolase [Thermodesulfobacteriota bacterium]
MRAIIFDLDDTLIVEEGSAEAAFLETCAMAESRFGVACRDLYDTIRETCRALWHHSPARAYCLQVGISSWEGLWATFEGNDENLRILHDWGPIYRRDSWTMALRKHGVGDEGFALELAEAFPRNRRKRHAVYDDVSPALEALKASFQLALLTNGTPDLQWEKIAGAGIRGYFDEIVVSGEVGFGKPDARIFRIMLSRLGVAAEETVMVGNSLKSDVGGAQAVGMKAVWINRTRKAQSNNIVPDLEVSSLGELLQAFS